MDKIIHCKAIVNGDLSAAFAMFTQSSGITEWLAVGAEVEPFVGGRYELFWDIHNKEVNSTIGCKVTAIEENEMLCFEWKGPVQFAECMNAATPLTHVAVFFTPQGEGTTAIHLVHTGWGKSGQWEEARNWFEAVWGNALKKLEDVMRNG